MLNLPKSTELNKQLPKKVIYAKFQMSPAAKAKFDADISRINIVGEISPDTTGIAQGQTVSSIFVLQVVLKQRNFQQNTIAQISKLIQTEWVPADACTIELRGMDLDSVWENFITQVGGITIQEGNTLEEQIAADEQRVKLEKEIARLEKLAWAEKQPKKKYELVQQITILKGRI